MRDVAFRMKLVSEAEHDDGWTDGEGRACTAQVICAGRTGTSNNRRWTTYPRSPGRSLGGKPPNESLNFSHLRHGPPSPPVLRSRYWIMGC